MIVPHAHRSEPLDDSRFEVIQGKIGTGLVAAIFHPLAGVCDGGTVSAERSANICQVHSATHVGKIHRRLPGESDRRAASL